MRPCRSASLVRWTPGLLLTAACLGLSGGQAGEPLRLHPANPHYLLFRGQPTVLITSGEHYGAVLNRDFDYCAYLDELQRKGLNLTRTFSGVYCEDAQDFGIAGNPLAPKAGRLLCPWARSQAPGYPNGGNTFDLRQWDGAYFDRLKDFLGQASRRGIVVEFVLFCPFYKDTMWNLSPMKASNNVNGIGKVRREEVYTLKHPDLLAVQDAFVRKVVAAMQGFDNVYFEICNEPYFGGVTLEWQHHIVATIVDAEARLGQRHLIAQNIANKSKRIERPNPAVSIFNFHYAAPPETVALNFGLGKAIADDETGFAGPLDATYRREGWEFILAGGAIYSNLDYSFTPAHPAGDAVPSAPGGGSAHLRTQLAILKAFIHHFDFVRMHPAPSTLLRGVPPKSSVRILAKEGEAYAIYLYGGSQANLDLDLPKSRYRAEWLDPVSGRTAAPAEWAHPGGSHTFNSPRYEADIALSIRRQ